MPDIPEISEAEQRRQKRLKEAQWHRDNNMENFIKRALGRRHIAVPLTSHCGYILNAGNLILLKDFIKIGSGGAGLVWGCGFCTSCSIPINKGYNLIKEGKKLPPFAGKCRMNVEPGDANKIVIIRHTNKTPQIIRASLENIFGSLQRISFDVE